MHLRYITVVLVGWLIGFAGQSLRDFFAWPLDAKDLTPYECSVSMPQSFTDRFVPVHRVAANQLIWQAIYLAWLNDRSESAVRTAALMALSSLLTMLAADQIREKHQIHEGATTP